MTVGNFSPLFLLRRWGNWMFGDNWFLVHQFCLLSTGVRFGDRNVERGLQENRACEHRSHAVNTKLSGSGQSSHDLLSIQCWNGINRPLNFFFISLVTLVTNKQAVLTMVHSKVSRTDYISRPSSKMLTVFSVKHD